MTPPPEPAPTGITGRLAALSRGGAAAHPMLAAPRRVLGLGLLVFSLGLTSVLVFVRAFLGLFR